MIIAIDFDNTITESRPYPEIAPIKEDAIKVIKKLKEQGNILILWTCRDGIWLQEAVSRLLDRGIKFDYINDCPKEYTCSRKIVADVYIDDRAFGGIVDWKLIEEVLCR